MNELFEFRWSTAQIVLDKGRLVRLNGPNSNALADELNDEVE
jgi:hypothetical protein